MSRFVNFLVYAKDVESAREKAHELVEEIKQRNNQHCLCDADHLCWRDPVGENRRDAVLQVSTERYPCDDKRGLERVNQAMASARKNFEKNFARVKYLADKYSRSDLFEAGYEYVKETEIEFNGQEVSLCDAPCEFLNYCGDITSDNGSGLYNIFAAPIGNAAQLKWILDHDLELTGVLTIGVDRNGERVCSRTRDPAVDMPLWIVMIEVFSLMEIEDIEPKLASPIAILVNASDAESALEIAKEATKKITDFEHCTYKITKPSRVDGRIVPPVSQVSTPYFPIEDQTGLEILREYLKAISSGFIQDVTQLRLELANFTNEELLNDAQNQSGILRYICGVLAEGSRADKTFLYEADYRVGGLMCDRIIRPWYIENRLEEQDKKKAMHALGIPPFNEPLWIVLFQVQGEHEEIEASNMADKLEGAECK